MNKAPGLRKLNMQKSNVQVTVHFSKPKIPKYRETKLIQIRFPPCWCQCEV